MLVRNIPSMETIIPNIRYLKGLVNNRHNHKRQRHKHNTNIISIIKHHKAYKISYLAQFLSYLNELHHKPPPSILAQS